MTFPEVYPHNFEHKIGFTEVREQIALYASSALGRSRIEALVASTDHEIVSASLGETSEMIALLASGQSLPSLQMEDGRQALVRIRPDRTFMEELELVALLHMLEALHALSHFFTIQATEGNTADESLTYLYPRLARLLVDAPTFPKVESHIRQLLDSEGRIKDTASRELLRLRRELRDTERSLSGMLQRILRTARSEGWIDTDTQPAMRDGRLVLPVSPQHKRKIKGIVHDESATGKTVFIEPVEMVEANNRIRELEGEERREVVRILMEVAQRLRPNISHLLRAYDIIAHIDSILAKARWAREVEATCPHLSPSPRLEWHSAKHPLLLKSFKAQGREVVPLDIRLDSEQGRILIISGPNAGGKSVCLKTVGLLQYMLQCGLPVPMQDHSSVGLFRRFYIDIGDEQSIEDDLSTYSSHLTNMKHFERGSDGSTLILIDEFGGGTEPTIGGAIAQALLERFNASGAYGVITTHYQNLKIFAEDTPGLINGAMLYDRHHMQPLFRLSIGRPGSSFAIEIARKIGLPEAVITKASEYVGTDYIDMDKYLQDIVRDKRYWETKRQNIRKEEKKLQDAAERYTSEAEETQRLRRQILSEAKREAEKIIQEAGSRIERTIREIREADAERERTLKLRADLKDYQESLLEEEVTDTRVQERAKREVEKLLRRRERKEQGKHQHKADEATIASHMRTAVAPEEAKHSIATSLSVGDHVRLEGQKAIATIVSIERGQAVIAVGMMKMAVPLDRLRAVSEAQVKASHSLRKSASSTIPGAKSIIDQIHDKRLTFRTDLDLRGMRVAEGVEAVAAYVDDALQLGIERVRILHGTGTGALKVAIREYLRGVRGVRHFADEHVQLGGAGITVVDLH